MAPKSQVLPRTLCQPYDGSWSPPAKMLSIMWCHWTMTSDVAGVGHANPKIRVNRVVKHSVVHAFVFSSGFPGLHVCSVDLRIGFREEMAQSMERKSWK